MTVDVHVLWANPINPLCVICVHVLIVLGVCVDAHLYWVGCLGMNPPDIPQPSQRYGCLFNMCNRQRTQIQSIKSINNSIVRSHRGTWLSSESEEHCFCASASFREHDCFMLSSEYNIKDFPLLIVICLSLKMLFIFRIVFRFDSLAILF